MIVQAGGGPGGRARDVAADLRCGTVSRHPSRSVGVHAEVQAEAATRMRGGVVTCTPAG